MKPAKLPKYVDDYLILKTLGTGLTAKVKLARHKKSGEIFALKMVDETKLGQKDRDDLFKSLKNELHLLEGINHPNIIKVFDIQQSRVYHSNNSKKTVSYAVLEYASKGELLDVLMYSGDPMQENTCRFYFQQVLSALECLHSLNIAHRDLKPENMLLDKNLTLKLVDFGFSAKIMANHKNITRLGTEGYMAPEVFSGKPYNADKSDIFSAGVVLFVLAFGKPPFRVADLSDNFYNTFITSNQTYWTFIKKGFNVEIEGSFIELMNGMLHNSPENRFDIPKIKSSPWFNKPINQTQAVQNMTMLHQKSHDFIELQKESSKNLESSLARGPSYAASRSLGEVSFFAHLQLKSNEELLPGDIPVKSNYINAPLDRLKAHLETATLKFVKQNNKITIEKNDGHGETVIKMSVVTVKPGMFGLRLLKASGSYFDFMEIKKKVIQFMNSQT